MITVEIIGSSEELAELAEAVLHAARAGLHSDLIEAQDERNAAQGMLAEAKEALDDALDEVTRLTEQLAVLGVASC